MAGKEETEAAATFASERLPDELSEFLAGDTYSLAIKGESGTGKTILALTILKALQPLDNVLYVSTRTSPLQLLEYHPWIEDIFGPPIPLKDAMDRDVGEGWETLVDSRLDEPNVTFERVTNVLMDKHSPVVVIDSWEALGDSLGSEAIRTNIRVLETWRERSGARFVFVGESPSNTAIDFVVGGIVHLRDRTVSGRRLREMVLTKLHGVEIRKPSHFFSLEGGSFRSFPGYDPDDYSFRNPLPVRLDRPLSGRKGKVPTGHAPLDAAMSGGFPQKSTALVDMDPDVDLRVGLVFVSKMVQDWTAGGGTVVLQIPDSVDPSFMRQYAKAFGAPRGRLQVPGRISRGPRRKGRTLVIDCRPGERGRKASTRRETAKNLPASADLTIMLGEGQTAGAQGAKLRISQIEGTLFVYGEIPWTPLMGVIPSLTAGNPTIELEPVV